MAARPERVTGGGSAEAAVTDPKVLSRLHDGPIQSLTAGSMWLLMARRKATNPEVEQMLEQAQDAVTAAIRDLRQILDERS